MLHEKQLRTVNQAIQRYRVKRVLEIAPGPARLSCQVTGFERGCLCDINTAMLSVAESRLEQAYASGVRSQKDTRWGVIAGDAFHLPFLEPFDMVYTFRFIRHFEARERMLLYHEIRSQLTPGGILIFDAVNAKVSAPLRRKEDPTLYPIYDELFYHDALVDEVARSGFRVLALAPVMRHMMLQQHVQAIVGPRSHRLARWLIQSMENVPGQPLEWIVACQKDGAS